MMVSKKELDDMQKAIDDMNRRESNRRVGLDSNGKSMGQELSDAFAIADQLTKRHGKIKKMFGGK